MAAESLQKTRLAAKLHVEQFRGVERAELKLAPITVVTGRNNSGKSSLLEALAAAASAPTGFRDWLGTDVVRSIIDEKLLGHPQRLLRSGATEANVELDYAGTRVRLKLRRPPSIEPEARRLACTALDKVSRLRLHLCILAASRTLESGARDHAYKLLDSVIDRVVKFCKEGHKGAYKDVVDAVAAALLDALTSAASLAAKDSVEVVHVATAGEEPGKVYYPGADRWSELSRYAYAVVKVSLRETLDELPKALQIEADPGELARCLATAFRDALDRAVREGGRGVATQSAHGTGPRVFTLFHRSLLGRRRSLVRAVTDAVKGLLGLGLLDAYREMLRSVSGLGFEDLLVAGGEVLLKTRSEVVPASVLGDGTLHLLLLTAGLALARGGGAVVVIEEPETGLHPGYMDVFARLLVDSVAEARGGHVLVAMSTHSLELIRYIAAAAKEKGLLDSLATVLMYEGEVYSVFQGEEAAEASELDVDLRGV